MYYSSFGILAIIIHFIINYDVLREPKNAAGFIGTKSYMRFLYSLLIYYGTDVLWGILYEQGWVIPTYIDTVLYFLSMVLSLLLWTKFVVSYLHRSNKLSVIFIRSAKAILLMEVLMLIVNLFVPIVFGFDEQGNYLPGAARYITLSVQILLFTTVAVYAFIVAGKVTKNKQHYRMVGCSGVMMTVCIVLQTIFPLLPYYAIGCMLTTCMIHSFIMQDIKAEYNKQIGAAQAKAYIDPLTELRNKAAYIENVNILNHMLRDGSVTEFAVIVFDLNNLKNINDELGHEVGDRYIIEASRLICNQFKHSPVFRIGGDEFVAILEEKDYKNRDSLVRDFKEQAFKNKDSGQVVIACGMSVYDAEKDINYEMVFERGDKAMYKNKKELKSGQRITAG